MRDAYAEGVVRTLACERGVQAWMHTVREFFDEYGRFTATGDDSGQDRFFAPAFMVASADGVRMLTPEQLTIVASKRRGMLDSVGRRGVVLAGIAEQPLDSHYVLVRSSWRWDFEPAGHAPFTLTLDATHILHRTPAGLRIVFYRTGDVTQALRDRGLAI